MTKEVNNLAGKEKFEQRFALSRSKSESHSNIPDIKKVLTKHWVGSELDTSKEKQRKNEIWLQ